MTRLYPYERKGVLKIERFGGRALLADEKGLGKTIQTLSWLYNFLGLERPAVVVCPASVKYHWQGEARKHFGMPAEVLENMNPPEGKPARNVIYVVNYDVLADQKGRKRRLRGWYKFLKRLRPALVVIDEVQYCANPRAKRSRAVARLCDGVRHVIGLTGTPILNTPIDLWHFLNVLDPGLWGSLQSFAFRYTRARKTPFGWEFKGGRRLKEFNRLLLTRRMIRRRKRDVLKDLPAVTYSTVLVPVKDRAKYDAAEQGFRDELYKLGGALFHERMRAMAGANELKTLVGRLKFDAVCEWVKDWLDESEGKLCVFTSRNAPLLLPLYEKFGGTAVLVTGKVRGGERRRRVAKFVEDKDCRLFLANMHAAGVGMDGLQHACDSVAFPDLAWTWAAHEQAEGRVDRIGQKNPVSVYYLLARGTIEERIAMKLKAKKKVADAAVDGRHETSGSASVFDEFIRDLLKRKKGG